MSRGGRRLPRRQRVAAYAVILRGEDILLSRLSPMVTSDEVWSLPGGGLDHGEDPRAAVVREVREETGLEVTVGETARVFSHHGRRTWRGRQVDAHALRIVYDGWVAADAPAPQTQEVGGTTSEAAWKPLAGVLDGSVPTVPLVRDALAVHRVERVQRVSAYALIRRGDQVLLTRNSVHGPHPGQWSLPGGGVEFGESPRETVVREVREETGLQCRLGGLLAVDDITLTGTAPSGRHEEFHGIHLIFAATVPDGAEPFSTELGGTTDAAAWVGLADIAAGTVPIRDVVRTALARLAG
ncbi:NUDIX domain-containing protein [Nocardioides sp.]|jgi:ADP-ribose pyrophosphatase YjhB (NUDIX family)|uniref:NUDIX domain-containing protein n=1 Tax=Nocardioides sp. TaxID=35761 RepID=UPI002BC5B913|nr:NUDIX domain-containing protein [Nocardioides sp.]HVX55593.1 NUDIX domain-containing protein [Nocardioides sp.]